MYIDPRFQTVINDATSYPYLSEIDRCKACDIVNVMLSAFDGDISTNGSSTYKATREISVVATVYDIENWNKSKDKLIELLNWVSGDSFSISFEKNEKIFETFLLATVSAQKKCITLFSGGLDSLAGAYYNFENEISSDYVGYVNKPEEGTHQKQLQKFYRKIFSKTGSEIDIRDKYQKTKTFYFQSTRSLLYLSLAISRAISNSTREIRMYENGVLSLNPDFGRFTTKTTHPKTIYLYNELLSSLGYDVKIVNKFEYMTKGEVIDNMNVEFKDQIRNTFTCGQSRAGIKYKHKGQCGVCIPCILRKISVSAYDNESLDSAYHVDYGKVKLAESNYQKDYINNLGYFEAYVEAIKEDKIFGQISHNKSKYHNDSEYILKQKMMFERFADEYERFEKKYGLR